MSNTWGALSWGQGEWAEQGDSAITTTSFSLTSSIGSVTATGIIEQGWGGDSWGINAWGELNSAFVDVSGISLTASIGSLTLEADANITPSGIEATSSPGQITQRIDVVVEIGSVSATTNIGNSEYSSGVTATGITATSSSGSVTIDDRYLIGEGWGRDVWGLFLSLPQPVIAAVHGYCFGSGIEMALCCDLRIAAEDAQFGVPEGTLGIIPAAGATQTLPRTVGRAKALEALLTGERIDAQEALRGGLVNQVVPREDLFPSAENMARRIISRRPVAVSLIKKAVRRGLDMSLPAGLHMERNLYMSALDQAGSTTV